ncbi:hypothetical protein FPV67DRAFT_1638885 [Lyophyllum atratum]|nr:hypothetical protein FPV67DRAFT_1638885 [Lyophyllum atratum]
MSLCLTTQMMSCLLPFCIALVVHAVDILIISRNADRLRRKLGILENWCKREVSRNNSLRRLKKPLEEHCIHPKSRHGPILWTSNLRIEDKNGSLTPKELKQLYMARVDCHLIQGCEISPDAEDVHVQKLCEVQVSFLRRMLNPRKKSMLAPLYTETRIMALCARPSLTRSALSTISNQPQSSKAKYLGLEISC